MLADTARELKARLSQRLGESPDLSTSSVEGATRWSGVALGLRPVTPDQVHLAIRSVTGRTRPAAPPCVRCPG